MERHRGASACSRRQDNPGSAAPPALRTARICLDRGQPDRTLRDKQARRLRLVRSAPRFRPGKPWTDCRVPRRAVRGEAESADRSAVVQRSASDLDPRRSPYANGDAQPVASRSERDASARAGRRAADVRSDCVVLEGTPVSDAVIGPPRQSKWANPSPYETLSWCAATLPRRGAAVIEGTFGWRCTRGVPARIPAGNRVDPLTPSWR